MYRFGAALTPAADVINPCSSRRNTAKAALNKVKGMIRLATLILQMRLYKILLSCVFIKYRPKWCHDIVGSYIPTYSFHGQEY